MNRIFSKFPALLLLLFVSVIAAPNAFGGSTIVIENGDAAGVGFNDPTPATPVGGNAGLTVGAQRLIAFQTAASIWGATLNSVPTITIHATWSTTMTCTSTTAILGSAGAASLVRDFPGAPFAGTWYSAALGNAIRGVDSNPGAAEINATFNANIGNTGCLDGSHWYYGLDGNHGSDIDLVAVLLHEFGHGFGFQTFTNASTGALNAGFPSVYDFFLKDNTTGKIWKDMTDTERQASAINTGNLVWVGPQVKSDAHGLLANPGLRVNSPAAIAGNYQVGTADFGPPLSTSAVTGTVAQALYGGGATDGCSPITSNVSGKIALIDRGNCTFITKTKNAQDAGATGVIIVNNTTGTPVGMTGSGQTINIPTVMISQADGTTIKAQLTASINASLLLDPSTAAGADSSGHPLLFAPNPFQSGSSVSHWDTSAFPNQLMEPNISGDLSHTVTTPKDLTASLLKDIGWSINVAATPTVQLSASSYTVNEGAGRAFVTVTRSDTTTAASVNYATSDTLPITNTCQDKLGIASSRCDYATTIGTLQFAVGQSSIDIGIPIVDDALAEGNETFTITLSNPVGATLGANNSATITIQDNDTTTGANPIDNTAFFVNQHYIDFLNRVPDGAYATWQSILNNCPASGKDANGNFCDRIEVSADFFRSEEFQTRGYFIYRFYKTLPSVTDPNNPQFGHIPHYSEFAPDLARVSGVLTAQQLEDNKVAFITDFMNRTEFQTKYGSITDPTSYVNALLQTVGLTNINPTTKTSWITGLTTGSMTRAGVLRALIESNEMSQKYFNEAFVIMQYFGYLRRDADGSYVSWITTMNSTNGDYRTMVNGFLNSAEYRRRFGP
jgi:hypothetical protein